MKLRESFEKLEEFDEDKCVIISEKYALCFALWISLNYIVASDGYWLDCKTLKKFNSFELMKIFKTEHY